MRHLTKALIASLAICAAPLAAHSEEAPDCELLLIQIIESEDGEGQAQVPSYIPAEEFFTSLEDDTTGHLTEFAGHKIQAVMCRRNDVIPAHEDYATLSTGIPFILSQDFDSSDTDSLTMYWKDGAIQYVYKGYPLSEEAEAILETRLEGFSKRGLNKWTHKTAIKTNTKTDANQTKTSEPDSDVENVDAAADDEADTAASTEIESKE